MKTSNTNTCETCTIAKRDKGFRFRASLEAQLANIYSATGPIPLLLKALVQNQKSKFWILQNNMKAKCTS